MNAVDSFPPQKTHLLHISTKFFLQKKCLVVIWKDNKTNKILLLEWRDLNIFVRVGDEEGIDDAKEREKWCNNVPEEVKWSKSQKTAKWKLLKHKIKDQILKSSILIF